MRLSFSLLFRTAAVLLSVIIIVACGDNSPILIGFSGPLEGKFADLGTQGRNGVQLFIEQQNAKGGINGRKLSLIAKNDGPTNQDAIQADVDLINQGVVAIIGHMTSQRSVAALDTVQLRGGLLLAPTTATPLLSGKKDAFFRVMSESTSWAKALANHASISTRRILVVYDIENEAYAKPYAETFREQFIYNGNTVTGIVAVSSASKINWKPILAKAKETEVTALFIAISAQDAATLAKEIHLQNMKLQLFCAPWAFTKEALLAGGKHIEGLTASITYTPDNTRKEFVDFYKAYEDRFGWAPSFAAVYGYEAMQALAIALAETGGQRKGLERALTQGKEIPGLIAPFVIDENGDVARPPYILTVRNGKMITIK